MKNKIDKKYSFILMIVIFISFTLLFNTYMEKKEAVSNNISSVIALKQDIEANTTIQKDMLAYKTVNSEDVTEDMYTDPEDILGMKALVPLFTGEILNKKRLSDFDSGVTNKDFAMKIDVTDKALNLVPGTFIDIWKVPSKEGFETGLEPEKVFSGEYIIDVKNETYVSYKDFNAKKGDSSDAGIFTPDYIVLNLDESKLKTVNNLNGKYYSLRITLHKDNGYYENLKDIQEEKSVSEEDLLSVSQEDTPENKEVSETIPKETTDQTSAQVIEEGDPVNEDN